MYFLIWYALFLHFEMESHLTLSSLYHSTKFSCVTFLGLPHYASYDRTKHLIIGICFISSAMNQNKKLMNEGKVLHDKVLPKH